MINPKDLKLGPTIVVAAKKPLETKTPKGVADRVRLHDGTFVPKKHYDSLLYHLLSRMHLLTIGCKYTLKRICNPRFLADLPLDNTIAGKCLANMVIENLLPLIAAGKTVQNANIYMRK